MSCLMLLTVTLDGGLQPLPELEADGGHHEAGVGDELSVPHLTSGHGDGFMFWVHQGDRLYFFQSIILL